MIKTKFKSPYTPSGSTTLTKDDKTGVYIIKENGKVVYIGVSLRNIYKTLYRHFENWIHSKQDVTNYDINAHKYSYRVVFCTPSQAHVLEKILIKKLKPRDNRHKHESYAIEKYRKQVYNMYLSTPSL